jgi:FtsP/CotA-like multicopper oxidase with cupredoxin domain
MMGSQRMADGRRLRTWNFGGGFNDDRSVPGPVIEGIEGQPVEVTLYSMMPHTIHFHGLDVDQANDGVPSTSGYVAGMGAGMRGGMGGGHRGGGMDFGRVEGYQHLGSPFTYRFIAPHAGTYMYHCHVDTVLHYEMGMYGTVIIRPPDGGETEAWTGGPVFDKEFVWHLHTFDSSWHDETISGSRTARYRPDYFMINGLDRDRAEDDPATAVFAAPGERVLIRLTNVGYQPSVVDLGGLEFEVVASDGRPLRAPCLATRQLVAPGERYDIRFAMPSAADFRATADYLDIRQHRVLGSASTAVRAV